MLEMREITKAYQGRQKLEVLDGVSLQLEKGKTLGLMGASGSGKSTLARILLMMEPADSGEICFHGQTVNGKDRRLMKQFRRRVQYISQHPESFLDPNWKIGRSVMEAAKVYGCREADQKLKKLLAQVKLGRAVLDRYPHQVSGGEIQRICLVRALLLEPKLLVLDEPTSMLDISVQAQILHLLRDIRREKQLAYLFITHDKQLAEWLCDRVLHIEQGQLK